MLARISGSRFGRRCGKLPRCSRELKSGLIFCVRGARSGRRTDGAGRRIVYLRSSASEDHVRRSSSKSKAQSRRIVFLLLVFCVFPFCSSSFTFFSLFFLSNTFSGRLSAFCAALFLAGNFC